ncbi:LacI family DNA-binding transcriptional regulator [Nesterenkonia ebinurensis]|uniref:LacI family DNA-binding transcriptional regulator n=1 Tax=Nesterenkonia ebinurensis TaxID=2608252 RepID=UPI00123E3345|nr:LacI family DNA-binding transcriptional regulator [Nesterenkonia ebinurensis]
MPAKRLPTLEDVAARAGVSRATASRVVNADPRVGRLAREAVQEAIVELGYRPNRNARSLVRPEVDSIAVVVPEAEETVFSDPFFAALLAAITQSLADSPVQVLLAMGQPGDSQKIERYLRGGYTDGAIVVSHHKDDHIWQVLTATKLPAVYVGRPYAGDVGIPYVDVDNRAGGALAAQQLVSTGRRRIGTITGAMDMAASEDRLAGWREQLHSAGLDAGLVEHGDFSAASGAVAIRRLLKREPQLDGVFVASDLMAVAAVHELQAAGRKVPEEIAVVGFDNSQAAELTRPPLTTVVNPVTALAGTAVKLLLRLLEEQPVESRVILETKLVRRASA